MSEYIETYQRRQAIRQRIKHVGKRMNPDQYWKLKNEEKELTKILTEKCK
jgi:hypothetical protein